MPAEEPDAEDCAPPVLVPLRRSGIGKRRVPVTVTYRVTPTTDVQLCFRVAVRQPPYSDEKVANRNSWDFGWEIAHAAVTRRPPVSLYAMVPRTGGYAYDVGVWDLSIVQGPFSVAPCQTLALRLATFASLYLPL